MGLRSDRVIIGDRQEYVFCRFRTDPSMRRSMFMARVVRSMGRAMWWTVRWTVRMAMRRTMRGTMRRTVRWTMRMTMLIMISMFMTVLVMMSVLPVMILIMMLAFMFPMIRSSVDRRSRSGQSIEIALCSTMTSGVSRVNRSWRFPRFVPSIDTIV